jgi:hypothetical protein
MSSNSKKQQGTGPRVVSGPARPHVETETQTATAATPERSRREHADSSARVPGDVDEARAVPTDIVQRKPGEPDAMAQMPAAAPSMTDEEAGLDDRPPEGGITPLSTRREA